MMRGFRAEWLRITRLGYLLGFGGIVVGISVLLTVLTMLLVTSTDTGAGPVPSLFFLEDPAFAAGPLVMTLGIASTAAVVLGALTTASEYGHGTLRVMLVAHPRRWSYLAGRTLALWALIGSLVVITGLVQLGILAGFLVGNGGDVSAWWTLEGLGFLVGTIGRMVATVWTWTLVGVMLAVLTRSAAAAIGIGIGYSIVVEPLFGALLEDAYPYLPGTVLDTFVRGVGPVLSELQAAALVVAYAFAFVAVALLVFERRDVSV